MDEQLGWVGVDRDDTDVVALRDHLAANNGIRGLDIFEPTDVERIVKVFNRDGFVVVDGVLEPDQTAELREASDQAVRDIVALDADRIGNRGSHRYSFGGSSFTRSMLHLPAWQMLVDLPRLTPLITAIFGSPDYMVRAGSGDFCLPGAVDYQPLHADMGDFVSAEATPHCSFRDLRGKLTTRDLPVPYVCVNFLITDMTPINGPTRQIPGTQNSHERPPRVSEEPEWMRLSTVCPAPAGAVMIRDVRAWHGGTPNVSDEVRAIPNIEFYAPWFREPTLPSLSYADRKKLSEHGQHITRFNVLDSSEELVTGYRIGPTPLRRED